MKIKVNYDAKTGAINGYYPDNVPYKNIPAPTIEIDTAAHKDCISNPGRRRVDLTTLQIAEYTLPGPAIEDIRAAKLAELDASAAAAYVGGFYSSASGSRLYYDSDKETQTLLANIYQRTKEPDWETKVRYPGISPAGKAPVRARETAADPDTAKAVQLLDAAQLKTLIDDLDAAFFAIKGKLWTLQAQVEAAEAVAEVEAVVWEV